MTIGKTGLKSGMVAIVGRPNVGRCGVVTPKLTDRHVEMRPVHDERLVNRVSQYQNPGRRAGIKRKPEVSKSLAAGGRKLN